jgi:hypothetical protein
VGGNDILKDVEKFINGKDSDLDSDWN